MPALNRIVRSCVSLALSLATAGCLVPSGLPDPGAPRERVVVSDGWLAMGTFFEADLRVPPGRQAAARAWLESAREEIARLEAVYSRHDPESELSELNRALEARDALRVGARVGPELEAILFAAVEVFEASGGGFDPTVGPLVALWQESIESGAWPSVPALRRAKQRVGAGGLLLTGDGALGVTAPGMRLDLDGISKGAVLDALGLSLADALPDASALVSFGGSSVLAIGDPEGRRSGGGWRLELHSRGESGRRLATIQVRDRALSVSSSVGRVAEIAGERVSHIVDPRTGTAVERTVEAIVIGERAGYVDGWSTALLVLGAGDDALRLAERAGIEVTVFESAGRIASTEGFEAFDAPVVR